MTESKINESGKAPLDNIVQPLLLWYGQNARALPWRASAAHTRMVSEIMLQQTLRKL